MATAQQTYDASQIKELGFPEAIQKRPGMYIGGRSNLHHLLAEVVDNSIDEAMAGHCTRIDVVINKDGSARVDDDGRGVPVDIHPESKKSALEMAFTQLHTGGKFDADSYSTSGGLHGVGVKATNALSEWLVVTVRRNGVLYRQRYEHGYVQSPVQILAPKTEKVIGEVGKRGSATAIKKHADRKLGTGTTVEFMPSSEYLEVTKFDFAAIAHRLQVAAFLIPGITLTLTDYRDKEPRNREYRYEGGLVAYVNHLNDGRKVIHRKLIRVSGATESGASVDVVLQYHDADDEELLSFVNTIPTSDGGTHVSGFRAALTKAINVFGQEKKQITGKDSVTGRDTTAGLTAALSVLMPEPEFTSQTKTQLGNREMHGQVMSLVYEGLLDQFRKDVSLGRRIVDRCLAAARAREAAAKARSLVMRKSVLDVVDTGLPGKLADVAKGADTAQTILYVVEGDSAGGSCKQARNNRYHAILPLRGKILNTERARLNRALSNNEIKAIVSAVGAGVARDFRVEDMRYGGVAIFVDADVDGLHIMTLLLTLFWRLMRPMIDEGRLYVAKAPLYQLTNGRRRTRYAYSDWERDQILNQWGRNGVTIQRYKGLGEMNPSQLKETVFDVPEVDGVKTPFANRNLYRVTVEDAHRANQMVDLWMGSRVGPRKSRLMKVWDAEQSYDENGEPYDEEDEDSDQ
ncbi:MAG: type IIA DNA topoisomerase subunit B [Anaerolineae bacterium]